MDTTTTNSSYEGDSSRVIEEDLVGLERKTYAYDAFGSALSLSSTPNTQYPPTNRYSYLYDPGSSVSLLVDSTGAVKESYGYTAYGSDNGAISKKASGFSQGSVPTNPVRFQGKRFDSGSGSYDMGARRYSAQAGRWLQQDFYADALDNLGLSQDPMTANRYAFLGANPVNYVEADGHFWKEIGYGFASGAGSTWKGVKQSANDPIGTYKSIVKTYFKDLSCTGCAIYRRIKGAASTVRSEYESGGTGQVIGRGLFEGALIAAPYGGAKAGSFLRGGRAVAAEVRVSRSRYPESAAHIEEAQAGGHPSVLTIDRAGAKARRSSALKGRLGGSGLDRDEYPPAMFNEGGSGASVKPINRKDNRGAGASIGKQCKALPNGSRVRVTTCA